MEVRLGWPPRPVPPRRRGQPEGPLWTDMRSSGPSLTVSSPRRGPHERRSEAAGRGRLEGFGRSSDQDLTQVSAARPTNAHLERGLHGRDPAWSELGTTGRLAGSSGSRASCGHLVGSGGRRLLRRRALTPRRNRGRDSVPWLSPPRQAKSRRRQIQHYEQVTNNVSQTCRFCEVSRRQVYTRLNRVPRT